MSSKPIELIKSTRYCYCQADADATMLAFKYYNEIKKEKEKMDAKKCERCGKLYEAKDAADCVRTYLPGLPVSDYDKENFTESRIRRDHSTAICIVKKPGNDVADLCPECREKLKNFFESGKDETNVIKKAEE